MAGSAGLWVSTTSRIVLCALAAALLPLTVAAADTLYKYRDSDGNWVFTDRQPGGAVEAEVRQLDSQSAPELVMLQRDMSDGLELIADNQHFVPVELVISTSDFDNVEIPTERTIRMTLDARSVTTLLSLPRVMVGAPAAFRFRYDYLPGDPEAQPEEILYRVPFATASRISVSQAYPQNTTHDTPDSRYAVDMAVPVGTGVYAARAGTVFEVASRHFRGGTDPVRDGPRANLVRILHEDGTMAIYAHLNWNSIRVRPGDEVARGEYIADSGNTGFSTGPHLHFDVQRNAGLHLASIPVRFVGAGGSAVVPSTGAELIVY